MEKLDPRTTALVLIDLQKGIAPFGAGPHASAEVFQRAGRLAARFRELKAPVALVRVGWSADAALLEEVPPRDLAKVPAGWLAAPQGEAVSNYRAEGRETP